MKFHNKSLSIEYNGVRSTENIVSGTYIAEGIPGCNRIIVCAISQPRGKGSVQHAKKPRRNGLPVKEWHGQTNIHDAGRCLGLNT